MREQAQLPNVTFEKTEPGRRAIQKREVKLTPCQRAVLITVNGEQSFDALVASAVAMGGTSKDVDTLISLGLIAPTSVDVSAPAVQGLSTEAPVEFQAPIDFIDDDSMRPLALPKGYDVRSDISAPAAQSVTSPVRLPEVPVVSARAVTLESLWPSEEVAVGDDWDVADGISEAAEVSGRADVASVKALALELLKPLGLRAMQLRRTVEAVTTEAQLRDIEPLIRDLLPDAQKSQLDSAFIGLE